jgi:hypothetical protein
MRFQGDDVIDTAQQAGQVDRPDFAVSQVADLEALAVDDDRQAVESGPIVVNRDQVLSSRDVAERRAARDAGSRPIWVRIGSQVITLPATSATSSAN